MSDVKVVRDELSEVSLYIGSVEGYNGRHFSDQELEEAVEVFQGNHEQKYSYLCAVRLERCRFLAKDYKEGGFELTVINYPRFPRSDTDLCDFVRRLGVFLLHKFKQNRLSMVARTRDNAGFIEMIEAPEAETTHRT